MNKRIHQCKKKKKKSLNNLWYKEDRYYILNTAKIIIRINPSFNEKWEGVRGYSANHSVYGYRRCTGLM